MPDRMKILFVCTGNTCRSPLAEAIARKVAIERGLHDVEAISAGTSAHDGAPASDGALLVGLERSLDLGSHNAALSAAGIQLQYEALDVEPGSFDEVLATLRAEHAFGNVTVPYKQRMCDACDMLTPLAERVGAVNVFWIDEWQQLVGDNSDV